MFPVKCKTSERRLSAACTLHSAAAACFGCTEHRLETRVEFKEEDGVDNYAYYYILIQQNMKLYYKWSYHSLKKRRIFVKIFSRNLVI